MPPKRKRVRRRKAVDLDFSSSSDSGSESDAVSPVKVEKAKSPSRASQSAQSDSDSSSSLDLADTSDSDSSDVETRAPIPSTSTAIPIPQKPKTKRLPSPERSPTPPLLGYNQEGKPILWGKIPGDDELPIAQKDPLYLEWREYYINKVVERFGSSLDTIRQEPDLKEGRLEALIQGLASGADLFTSESDNLKGSIYHLKPGTEQRGEREIGIEALQIQKQSQEVQAMEE